MERDAELLPHDFEEYGDREEKHWGVCSRGSMLPCGRVEKNQWWVLLCTTTLADCSDA
jgi:hypothetical protein